MHTATAMFKLPPVEKIFPIFDNYKTVAVVGLSAKTSRPSHQVAAYLLGVGFRIIPINPGQTTIMGQTCFPNLLACTQPIEIVNIFRPAPQVLPFIYDAITIGTKVIWLQEGIVNEEAGRLAEQAGLTVIMDRCIKTDHLHFYPFSPKRHETRNP